MKIDIPLLIPDHSFDRPLRIAFGKGRGFLEAIDFIKIDKTREFIHFMEGRIPVYFDRTANVQLVKIRNKDLHFFLEQGHIDVAIGSSIWFDEYSSQGLEIFSKLPLLNCRLSLIASKKTATQEIRVICTRFQNIVQQYVDSRNMNARIVVMEGCHEAALYLNIADAIIDVIETGETIKRMRFTELETIQTISHEIRIRENDLATVSKLQDYIALSFTY